MPENTNTFLAHIAEFSFELDLPNNLIFFSTFSWSFSNSLAASLPILAGCCFLVEKIFIYNPEGFLNSKSFPYLFTE